MEWRSATNKEKYGDIIGEVIHHKLLEDGTIPSYDVKFGKKTIKNIPANKLIVVKEQGHSHEADDGDNDDEKEEGFFGDWGRDAMNNIRTKKQRVAHHKKEYDKHKMKKSSNKRSF